MPKHGFAAWMFSAATMVLGAGLVSGQDFPNKAVRIITGPIGGANDITARIIAQALAAPLGQPVLVQNQGASQGGTTIAELVAKAPPDGYTLLNAGGSFTIGPLLRKLPYDPVSDFSPVSLMNRAPLLLVVHASLPINSVKELIAYAKANPGVLNHSTGGSGGSTHLGAELFKVMTGVNMVRIAYNSGSQEITDLVSGRVQLTFGSGGNLMEHVKAGKLRALAVTTLQPSALFPGLPTVAESGVPDYQAESFDAIFAPAKTPAAIINRLNQEFVRVLNQPDVKQKFIDAGGVEAASSSPEGLAAIMKSEIARWGKLIKDAGIKVD